MSTHTDAVGYLNDLAKEVSEPWFKMVCDLTAVSGVSDLDPLTLSTLIAVYTDRASYIEVMPVAAAAVAVAEVTSMNGDPESRAGALYELHLSQAWKASLPANLRVLTKTTCAYRMQVGEHHLIYLMPTTAAERAHFETRACMGNSATEKAKLSLNWLSSQREADITN